MGTHHFNSRPHGGRPSTCRHWLSGLLFQLTPSRRATYARRSEKRKQYHFNSRPHGGRRIARSHIKSINIFQLTPSRRATHENHLPLRMVIFQLTPSRRATILSRIVERKWKDFNSRPHGGRLQCNRIFFSHGKISTHALTEGDFTRCGQAGSTRISTHALTEGDKMGAELPDYQSYFNSRPHGGRRAPHGRLKKPAIEISTHALTEGDFPGSSFLPHLFHFNSRPHGGRRIRFGLRCILAIISTHALTEGDVIKSIVCVVFCISTHALTEGDNQILHGSVSDETFQLTPSRRATAGKIYRCSSCQISTHALTEGDQKQMALKPPGCRFQLTPSRRATEESMRPGYALVFQLTPSRRATFRFLIFVPKSRISTHALTEGDPDQVRHFLPLVISTHALTEGDMRPLC